MTLTEHAHEKGLTERRRLLAPLHHALDVLLNRHRELLVDGVILAVSGGPDSRALLEAWAMWGPRDRVSATVVSVDHQTGEKSRSHAEDVVSRAHVLALDGTVMRVHASKLDEASLRRARREGLAKEARRVGARVIVTAHHADDEAEGALLAILGSGGGPEGAGMPLLAPFDVDDAHGSSHALFVARPFLGLRKTTLQLACTGARAFDVVTDARDARGIGVRATVRRHALPHLDVLDTDAGARLARHASLLREVEEALVDDAQRLLIHERDAAGDPVVRVRFGPRATMRRAVKLGSALVRGSATPDARGSARTIDALLDALGGGPLSLGRSAGEQSVVDDKAQQKSPVRRGEFRLAGVVAEIVLDASGRGEIVLSRPCR
jgi:tRNA(Ile)-lysidine synthase